MGLVTMVEEIVRDYDRHHGASFQRLKSKVETRGSSRSHCPRSKP